MLYYLYYLRLGHHDSNYDCQDDIGATHVHVFVTSVIDQLRLSPVSNTFPNQISRSSQECFDSSRFLKVQSIPVCLVQVLLITPQNVGKFSAYKAAFVIGTFWGHGEGGQGFQTCIAGFRFIVTSQTCKNETLLLYNCPQFAYEVVENAILALQDN